MKLLHTSDWHIGRILGGHSLIPDQEHALAQIESLVRDDPHDLMIVAGDVFDRASPSPEAMRVLGRWIQRIHAAAPAMRILVTAGNHDSGARLAWAAGLMADGLHFRGDTESITTPLTLVSSAGVPAQVWAIPFLDAGVMGEATPGQSAALAAAIDAIRPLQDPGHAQILVAHCFVRDGAVSDSERTLVGTAVQVDPAQFEGFDYVALGHLHKPQQVAPNARYSGSLSHYSFSEAGHQKGVLSITVQTGLPHTAMEHPLIPLRAMSRIVDSFDRLMNAPEYVQRLDHYVELTVDPRVQSVNLMEQLRTRWNHILSLRNQDPAMMASVAETVVTGPTRDIHDDFSEFDKLYRGAADPDQAVLTEFSRLVQALDREDTLP